MRRRDGEVEAPTPFKDDPALRAFCAQFDPTGTAAKLAERIEDKTFELHRVWTSTVMARRRKAKAERKARKKNRR